MIQRKNNQMVIEDPDVEFGKRIYVELCEDSFKDDRWYIVSDSTGDAIRLTPEELEEVLKATKELG